MAFYVQRRRGNFSAWLCNGVAYACNAAEGRHSCFAEPWFSDDKTKGATTSGIWAGQWIDLLGCEQCGNSWPLHA